MKIKSIVTAMFMAGTIGAGAATVTQEGMLKQLAISGKLSHSTMVKKVDSQKQKIKYSSIKDKKTQVAYFKENQHEGTKRYIVRLVDDSVASYKGGAADFDKTNRSARKSGLNNPKFDPKSSQSKKYASYLEQKQASLLSKASSQLGISMPNLRNYKYAINGLLTELTFAQAQAIGKMKEVAFIQQDKKRQLHTDVGPILIGADSVWDGTAGDSAYMGEGIIIGMLDTGVNTDHRSFAATGDDGYTVVNPFGADVYVGDCVADATLCNSKLIGVHSYAEITDHYSDAIFPIEDQRPAVGEDHNGHGSHTSSTAGGNVLTDVPVVVNDPASGNTGDGIETATILTRMSGVAPHANIISYQVCDAGNTGDTFGGCPESATVAAIEDAITDGVNILNYSIGGVGPLAWQDAVEIGFLNAQAAGIFVATSSGNSGPGPSTTTAMAPWYTSVGATTHGRSIDYNLDFDGSNFSFAQGTGPVFVTDVTGPVIYSGDVDAVNFEGCVAFAADSFAASVALISRGGCAFADKLTNAQAAGAAAMIVFNNAGGDVLISMAGLEATTIPSVGISQNSGASMTASLTATPGLSVTINAAGTVVMGQADDMASFSSRGRNTDMEVMSPQIAAPGVSIYAAFADDKPFHDVTVAAPRDFGFLQGTSMASPHVAGAAALIMQAKPSWNADQVRSALMMTATTAVLKEDGATPADIFDMGSGRVQVNEAINAGLVMSESQANYLAADPASGGDPKTLNVPSMSNYSCAASCSWTRTFNVVIDGTYTITTSNAVLTSDIASFVAVAGDSVSVVYSLDVTSFNTDSSVFETVSITSAGQPDLHLPVYALVNNGAVPDEVNMTAGRDNGSWTVEGVKTIPTDNLNFVVDGLFDANAVGFSATEAFDIAEDPTNAAYDDDLSQVFVFEFDVPANAVSLSVAITEATSPDNDLFLEIDSGGGAYQLVALSATGATLESIALAEPDEGHYRIIIQNWAGSAAPTDTGTVEINVVPQTDPVEGLSVSAPTTADGDVAVELLWDIAMVPGDSYFADITVLAGTTEIGTFRATLDRVADDFSASAVQTIVSRGEQIDYTVMVNPTVYNQDVDYSVSIDMPPNMTLVEGSAAATGGGVTIKDPNAVGLDLSSDFDIPEDPTNTDYRDDLSQVHVFEFEVPSGTVSLTASISGSTSPDNDLFVEFDSLGDGSFDTLVAFAATGATDETAIAGSPEAGMYRAIVQNWAGSAAASDTGSLSITTVPATGEGIIWTISAPGVKPLYTVTSSADDASCANSAFGGYVSLAANGFTALAVSGDTFTGDIFSGGLPMPFFGEDRDGVSITDDGFLIFSGTSGASPWANTSIPNAAEPNDMLALFWKDLEIVNDGIDRGIYGFQSSQGFSYIDYSNVQGWGEASERFSFAAFVWDSVGDGAEIIVSYSNNQTGAFSGATAGVENADGTIGTDASSLVEPGVQLCYDYHAPPQAFEVTFSVVPEAQYLGATAAPEVTIDSSMEGTESIEFRAAPVELVNVGPTANAGPDVTYDRADAPSQIVLSAAATLDLDEDVMSYAWTQVSGTTVSLASSGTIQAFFNLKAVSNGTYTFSVEVSDGEFTSSDEVTIVIEGKESNSGVGSMGILVLLMGMSVFFRRRFFK